MAHVLPIDQPSADQKAARIQDALQALRAAHEIDERDDALDVASLTAWYEQTIPTVKDITILSGAIAVELEARLGALVTQEGERRGGSKLSRRDSLTNAEHARRKKARALHAQPEARTHYVKTEAEAGRKPTVKGALRAVRAVKHASSPPTAKPSTRSSTAFADSVRIEVRGRIEAVADQALTLDELAKRWKVHTDIARRYLREAVLVATVTEDNRRYTVTLTQDAEIVTIRKWFRTLRTEITRRRLENHDNRKVRRWNPMASDQHEFRRLLNWIETQLDSASGSLQ